MCLAALWLQKKLMAFSVSKPHDLVFNARAVSGSARLDLACVHWRTVEIRSDKIVDLRRCASDPAGELLAVNPVGQKRKRLRFGVASLYVELGKIDRFGREPAGSAGLEPLKPNAHLLQ